jgi:RHS repeat-associated protein
MSTPAKTVYFDTAYAPFGEDYNGTGATDRSFGGMTQDIPGAGNYVTPMRQYNAGQGRWLSPDIVLGNVYEPQRLNRYAYVRNAPLTSLDPSGADDCGDGFDCGDCCWDWGYVGDPMFGVDFYYWGGWGISPGISLAGGSFGGSDSWDGNALAAGIFSDPVWNNAAGTLNFITGFEAGGFTGGLGLAGISATGLGTAAVSAWYTYGVPITALAACAEFCDGMGIPLPALSAPVSGSASIPRGFSGAQQFAQASEELSAALSQSGITDATIGVRGSSVTGFSYRTGLSFDAVKRSDIDFFVESRQLTQGLDTSLNIPGFVHPKLIRQNFLPIAEWSQRWSGILGRKVSVGGFQGGTAPTGTGVLLSQ